MRNKPIQPDRYFFSRLEPAIVSVDSKIHMHKKCLYWA